MKAFLGIVKKVDYFLNTIAEFFLVIMVLLTVTDVLLRYFGSSAITGTYELVAIMGGIVIAFAVPQTSWDRGHVFVDFLIENRTPAVKNTIYIITRIIGIVVMFFLSWNLMKKGMHLQKAGEVSMTLHVPFYPWCYAFAVCFFIVGITLVADIFKIFNGGEQK
ncbi:MAG: TRAP transporter small permease [Spirochaetes bacterium]|nr:TRAP transporter small permease [Spirochaetota bacterium]